MTAGTYGALVDAAMRAAPFTTSRAHNLAKQLPFLSSADVFAAARDHSHDNHFDVNAEPADGDDADADDAPTSDSPGIPEVAHGPADAALYNAQLCP